MIDQEETVNLSTVLTVLRAFPCRSRLKDTDTAAAVEEEVMFGVGDRPPLMYAVIGSMDTAEVFISGDPGPETLADR